MSTHNSEVVQLNPRESLHSYTSSPRNPTATLSLGVLEQMISYQLRRAQARVLQHLSARLEADRITPAQLNILIKIRNNPGLSQTALAKENGIERSTLGEIVDRFEQRGWIERRRHRADRRVYALYISASGDLLLDNLIPAVVAEDAALTADWSEEDRSVLLRLLCRLADDCAP